MRTQNVPEFHPVSKIAVKVTPNNPTKMAMNKDSRLPIFIKLPPVPAPIAHPRMGLEPSIAFGKLVFFHLNFASKHFVS